MKHFTIRVAWHDNLWNGTVCCQPSKNSSCLSLRRIKEIKDDALEEKHACEKWPQPNNGKFPACVDESGGFMNPNEFLRVFKHPYQDNTKTQQTHGNLRETTVILPPYSAFAIPFWWTLREHQQEIDDSLTKSLPPDDPMPEDFKSDWVFGRKRQEAILKYTFDQVIPEKSLAMFYCKDGHPVDETTSRLVVGLGTILKIGKPIEYATEKPGQPSYVLWDRIIQHSIRPDGKDGFLIPYHAYLSPTGDSEEDERRSKLLQEIVVAPTNYQQRTFSYVGELAGWDVTLGILARCLQVIRNIKKHGIAPGQWDKREEWVNKQIDQVWKDRGAFPGLGPALEAMGLRLGTSFVMDLAAIHKIKPEENPWPLVDAIFQGNEKLPLPVYTHDILEAGRIWKTLSPTRKSLLNLLSRFELTSDQATRWFNPENRPQAQGTAISDDILISNPYLITDWDEAGIKETPIALVTIDRGLFPDSKIAANQPISVLGGTQNRPGKGT